jgi:hypothetical protein
VSFEGGVLTLRLASGRDVSGLVDEASSVECESGDSWSRDDEDDDLDDEGDDEDSEDDGGDSGDDEDVSDDDSDDDSEKLAREGADDESVEDEDSSDDSGDDASDDDEADCVIEPGAFVHDAELELIDGELVFTLVELVG